MHDAQFGEQVVTDDSKIQTVSWRKRFRLFPHLLAFWNGLSSSFVCDFMQKSFAFLHWTQTKTTHPAGLLSMSQARTQELDDYRLFSPWIRPTGSTSSLAILPRHADEQRAWSPKFSSSGVSEPLHSMIQYIYDIRSFRSCTSARFPIVWAISNIWSTFCFALSFPRLCSCFSRMQVRARKAAYGPAYQHTSIPACQLPAASRHAASAKQTWNVEDGGMERTLQGPTRGSQVAFCRILFRETPCLAAFAGPPVANNYHR